MLNLSQPVKSREGRGKFTAYQSPKHPPSTGANEGGTKRGSLTRRDVSAPAGAMNKPPRRTAGEKEKVFRTKDHAETLIPDIDPSRYV
jgi:hypothetical protein